VARARHRIPTSNARAGRAVTIQRARPPHLELVHAPGVSAQLSLADLNIYASTL
jgi:hypothetical protein